MSDNQPTDYAAIIRAAQNVVPEPPEWLTTGKQVYSPEYGVGDAFYRPQNAQPLSKRAGVL